MWHAWGQRSMYIECVPGKHKVSYIETDRNLHLENTKGNNYFTQQVLLDN